VKRSNGRQAGVVADVARGDFKMRISESSVGQLIEQNIGNK